LKAQFRKWARGKQFLKHTKNGDIPEHLVATRATVADWLEALDEFTLLPDDQIPPCWINDAAGPVACDMVVFKNGVLDVSGYITGEKHRTIAPSPNLFTLSAIPYDFDPDAKCPAWLTFLEKTLGASDKIALLQEYAGLCLVPDSQYQKFLYLMGRSGSGKGTVLSGFRNFLGEENVRSAQTKDFLADFGTQASMGKRVTIFSDARLHGGNAASFLENLLTMTGEDSPGIRRKFLPDAPGQSINCQWMFASNGVLDLEDTAEALPRRVMLLTFDGDFTGDRADTSLRKKHFAERQGIANWALEGLKRLRHRGDFTVPESSKVAMEEWRHETNPARMFIDECCVLDPTAKIDLNMVLDAAQAWCKKQKGGSSSWCKGRPTLERSLKTASDGKIKRTGSKQPPYTHTFSGITLTGAAETRLLGKPGGAK
jgi:P4 family phage/plasmid primase-like protien